MRAKIAFEISFIVSVDCHMFYTCQRESRVTNFTIEGMLALFDGHLGFNFVHHPFFSASVMLFVKYCEFRINCFAITVKL